MGAVRDKISGMVNTALLGVVIVLQLTLIFLGNGWKEGLEALDHVGSFLGGVAGLTAAGIALLGFNVWKRQITHGKYLTLIWEAMVALQRLESHLSLSGLNLFFRFETDHNEHFTKAVAEDRLITEQLFSYLKESCAAVDVVAARNGVELSNLCEFMRTRVLLLYHFTDKPGYVNSPEGIIVWSSKVADLNEPVTVEANLLRRKLKDLEQKFG